MRNDLICRSPQEEGTLNPVPSLHGHAASVYSQKNGYVEEVPPPASQDSPDESIEKYECENDHTHQLWSPLFLRRKVLALFVVSFIAMIATLAVLYIYCERNQGLSTVNPKQHYLWTYGPVAGMALDHLSKWDELTVVHSIDNYCPFLGSS
jgi:hypothetical protein